MQADTQVLEAEAVEADVRREECFEYDGGGYDRLGRLIPPARVGLGRILALYHRASAL